MQRQQHEQLELATHVKNKMNRELETGRKSIDSWDIAHLRSKRKDDRCQVSVSEIQRYKLEAKKRMRYSSGPRK